MKIYSNKTLILSNSDVQQIISHIGLNLLMDELITRTTAALQNFDPAKTIIPVRAGFSYEKPFTGLVEWMPVFERDKNVAIKIVGYHPANPTAHQLPTILSTVSIYDISTGHLAGLMDGVLLTALRTGAASAIASRFLAHPESEVLGLIGCGAQAVTQLHALSKVFDFKKIMVYDVDVEAALSFGQRCGAFDFKGEIVLSNVEEIVEEADILCTATSIGVGEGPLFENLPTKTHLHINAVGSDFPGKVEVPLDFLENSFVCPDFLEQAVTEGECQRLSPEQIGDDWVKVAKQPSKYARFKNQHTVFDSTGWALEDQVAMELFMEHAQELGLGQYIGIENISTDVKNPYHFLQETQPSWARP